MNSNFLVYDCEIMSAIQGKNEGRREGIVYCDGWRDFEHMGISVIGAYDYLEDRYRVFCKDNFAEFQSLVNERRAVSFNGLAFDDRLCAANGIHVVSEYDLLVEVWAASGLDREFQYPSHAGYGLDACCKENGIGSKTGNGSLAPVLWQRGEIGAVIDYCLQDVRLTKRLFDLILTTAQIVSPKSGGYIKMRNPG